MQALLDRICCQKYPRASYTTTIIMRPVECKHAKWRKWFELLNLQTCQIYPNMQWFGPQFRPWAQGAQPRGSPEKAKTVVKLTSGIGKCATVPSLLSGFYLTLFTSFILRSTETRHWSHRAPALASVTHLGGAQKLQATRLTYPVWLTSHEFAQTEEPL